MGRWSKQGCIKSAREYNDLKTWIREKKTSYLAARDNGWLDECCTHMELDISKTEWTFDLCAKEAKKFKTRSRWSYEEPNSYNAALKNGWLDECCFHMEEIKRSPTKQDCINAAKPYSSIDDFCKNEYFHFKIAKEKGWLPEIKDIYYLSKVRSWIEKNLGGSVG